MKLLPLPVLLALLSVCACSDSEPTPGGSSPPGTTAETAGDEPLAVNTPGDSGEARSGSPRSRSRGESGPPQPIDPATLGTIRIRCLFEGEPPKRREIDVSRERVCDVHAAPLLTEKVIVNDGRLANVFVHLKSGYKQWIFPETGSGQVRLEQIGCVYTPHVVALQRGQRLVVTNDDELSHNVNVRTKRNKSRNVTQASGSPPLEIALDERETSIQVKCDIHPWMGAVVHVTETPWFGVSDGAGELSLEGVPPGSYVLEAVHEDLGKQRVRVTLAPSGTATATFTFED